MEDDTIVVWDYTDTPVPLTRGRYFYRDRVTPDEGQALRFRRRDLDEFRNRHRLVYVKAGADVVPERNAEPETVTLYYSTHLRASEGTRDFRTKPLATGDWEFVFPSNAVVADSAFKMDGYTYVIVAAGVEPLSVTRLQTRDAMGYAFSGSLSAGVTRVVSSAADRIECRANYIYKDTGPDMESADHQLAMGGSGIDTTEPWAERDPPRALNRLEHELRSRYIRNCLASNQAERERKASFYWDPYDESE